MTLEEKRRQWALESENIAPKPVLRGWLHAVAAVAAIVITIVLLLQTQDDRVRFFSLLVFGLSMIELYTVSAVYHLIRWRGKASQVVRAIDHVNIFVFIAGTYTPFCVNLFDGALRIVSLSLVWGLVIVGVGSVALMFRLPRWFHTSLYVAMGWIVVGLLPWLAQALTWQALAVMALGGLCYTTGGVVYAIKRPDPLPRIFGYHEVFHLLTIAGGAAFLVAIWVWVVPFTGA